MVFAINALILIMFTRVVASHAKFSNVKLVLMMYLLFPLFIFYFHCTEKYLYNLLGQIL